MGASRARRATCSREASRRVAIARDSPRHELSHSRRCRQHARGSPVATVDGERTCRARVVDHLGRVSVRPGVGAGSRGRRRTVRRTRPVHCRRCHARRLSVQCRRTPTRHAERLHDCSDRHERGSGAGNKQSSGFRTIRSGGARAGNAVVSPSSEAGSADSPTPNAIVANGGAQYRPPLARVRLLPLVSRQVHPPTAQSPSEGPDVPANAMECLAHRSRLQRPGRTQRPSCRRRLRDWRP